MNRQVENDLDGFWTSYRSEFYIPENRVYLDGNSLGLASRRSEQSLLSALTDWKRDAIDSWGAEPANWFHLPQRISELTAPLIGTDSQSIASANSTTVNLHQLLATLYRPQFSRSKIVIDQFAFPTDRYAVESHLRLQNRDLSQDLIIVHAGSNGIYKTSAFESALSEDVAIVLLPSVVYTTGQLLDIQQIAKSAHAQGILIGVDCSHSIGVVPHHFDDWGVDFAIWSTYKYLNGGPGSASGLYLNAHHHSTRPGLSGWFGVERERQFDMADVPEFARDAKSMQIGTPNILSMAPLTGALEMINEVGVESIRLRSLQLTEHLIHGAVIKLHSLGYRIVTPQNPGSRGGHIALAHPEAIRICLALRDAGIIVDFRYPDMIRIAPVPLYNTFDDCDCAINHLYEIVSSKLYEQYPADRPMVV